MTPLEIPADLPVFEQQDDLLLPTSLTAGPWYEGTQHGSAMLLMAALAAEQYPSDIPRQVTRLTVDMMKAAPMSPIQLKTTVRKGGRNMEVLDISILSSGEEYVHASALRYRVEDLSVPDRFRHQGSTPQLSKPFKKSLFTHVADKEGFHHAIDVRMDVKTQPAVMWFRLKQPILPSLFATPFLRVALAADWTYSIPNIANRILTGEGFADQPVYGINPDTTLNLHRQAEGEWIGIQTHITYGDLGAGTVMGQIFDELGPLGFSSQSILIRGRNSAPLQVKQSKR